MKLSDAIRLRRTLHVFNDKEVPSAIIYRAIEAANLAPCHRLTFPWRFTSLDYSTRKLLAERCIEINSMKKLIDINKKDNIMNKFLNPSHLLVVSQVKNDNEIINLEDYAACACAIQNLALSLTSDGVGSKWSTGKITKDELTYKLVGINQDLQEIIGFIFIGYGETPPPVNRPSVNTIFRVI